MCVCVCQREKITGKTSRVKKRHFKRRKKTKTIFDLTQSDDGGITNKSKKKGKKIHWSDKDDMVATLTQGA